MNKYAYAKLMGLQKKANGKRPVLTSPGVGYGPGVPQTKINPKMPSVLQAGKAINQGKSVQQAFKPKDTYTDPASGLPLSRLAHLNKKYGPVEDFIPSITAKLQLKATLLKSLLLANEKQKAISQASSKAMKGYLRGEQEKQMGQRTAIGANSVFDYADMQKNSIPEASMNAFKGNLNKFLSYKNKGWWERLLEWVRHMWANVSGGNPLETARGAAMHAGTNAANFYGYLPEKLKKSLQK